MKSNSIYNKYVSEIFNLTQKIISKYGPRIPGSNACINTAKYLEEEFKKVCDKAYLHEYVQFPGAFYNINKIIVVTYIAASILYLFQGKFLYVSSIIYSLGMFYFINQFIFMGTLFDRIFKKVPGYNVIGVVEPLREVKQQIIISGHHDSTYICNFLEKNQKYYSFRLIIPILFFIYAMVASILSSLFEITGLQLSILFTISAYIICGGFLFIIPLYFYHSKYGAPGAGDNLLSSVMCVKIPEIIKQINGPLKNTRLVLLSTDGEEIGQKGSQSFIKHYINEIKKVKTYVFNIDSIYKSEDLAFLKSELNGTIKLSKSLLKELKTLSKQSGFSIKIKKFPVGGGGTDAGQFAKMGIDTVSLIGISTNLIRKDIHYHTSSDIIENIEPQSVYTALKIAVKFILKRDREIYNEKSV